MDHHGLRDNERPYKEEDRVGRPEDVPESAVRVEATPEEHTHRQGQHRRHGDGDRFREPVNDDEGEDRRQGLLLRLQPEGK